MLSAANSSIESQEQTATACNWGSEGDLVCLEFQTLGFEARELVDDVVVSENSPALKDFRRKERKQQHYVEIFL